MAKARLVGLNHVALEVGDVEAALAFYGAAFDLRLRGRGPRTAFVDMGDQFVALEAGRTQPPDQGRHLGLVVDDPPLAVRLLVEAGGTQVGDHDVLDPWGNRLQLVAYRDVQFTKAPAILRGMGIEGLEKSERARAELREAGLAPD